VPPVWQCKWWICVRLPLWPRLDARIGVQYTLFNKVNNGAIANFNGMGRNAHNNNTIFVYTWIAF